MIAKKGVVYLVGAGPGSPDLITLRGLRAIYKSDVIICDKLIPDDFFENLGLSIKGKEIIKLDSALKIKRIQTVENIILQSIKIGKVVTRLKIGDPMIFGRHSEELEFLLKHNIQFEIIPGLSSVTSSPCLANVPLTWRNSGRSFSAVTARCEQGKINEIYPETDTLIILMGINVFPDIIKRLINNGWSKSTPFVIIEKSSMLWERRIEGKLGEVINFREKYTVSPPAIIVIGEGARKKINYLRRPVILFTGFEPEPFRPFGEVLHWNALEIESNEFGIRRLDGCFKEIKEGYFDKILFTSGIAVRLFFRRLREKDLDSRIFARSRIIACGEFVRTYFYENGILVDYYFDTHNLTKVFKDRVFKEGKILVLTGNREVKNLRNLKITTIPLYYTKKNKELGKYPLPEYDIICFTNSDAVKFFFETYGEKAFFRQIWCSTINAWKEVKKLGFKAELINMYSDDIEESYNLGGMFNLS